MTQTFLQITIPVLYVYDEGVTPEDMPGFPMSMLPVVSRALKENAGTSKVTVITGTPAPKQGLDEAFTHLALQYAHLEKASPEAGALLAAEFLAENFDAEAVLKHLQTIVETQQRELAADVERRFGNVEPGGDVPGVEEDAAAAGGEDDAESVEETAEADEEAAEADEDGEAGDADDADDADAAKSNE